MCAYRFNINWVFMFLSSVCLICHCQCFLLLNVCVPFSLFGLLLLPSLPVISCLFCPKLWISRIVSIFSSQFDNILFVFFSLLISIVCCCHSVVLQAKHLQAQQLHHSGKKWKANVIELWGLFDLFILFY